MKRLLINTTLLIVLAGVFSSCKKKIEEDYLNPELTTTGSLGKLFSGMYMNKRIHPSYWDYYTFVMSTTAPFAQTAALQPASQMYIPSSSYTENRWTDFYAGAWSPDDHDLNYYGPGIMSSYREMQTSYAALSPAQQQQQAVFLKCAQVLLYDQAAQMIDLWGDIPFTEAGSLNTSRTVVKAPFDDAATLYNTMIADLKALNTYFDTATIATATAAELAKQDLMYKGNLSNWQRYANSLRLRLLMRISNVSEASAKTEVTAMLNDAATYPLITDNASNAVIQMSPTAFKSDLLDVFTSFGIAPAYLLDTLMVANNDPRTVVYWDPNPSGVYKGLPYNGTSTEYDAGGYATYDSATFYYNYNIPAVLFTASEVSFLQAEAYERWSLGTAQTAYETGV
ncbi:MAG TPA: SusD/RagB family nutrient-binding outer membrane lipoprotein, partial [Chitinophaga sp.]